MFALMAARVSRSTVAAATVLAALAIGCGGRHAIRPTGGSSHLYPPATLPPQTEPVVSRAARAAGCELRRVGPWTSTNEDDPFPTPAPDGIYDRKPDENALAAAFNAGRVAFFFAPDTPANVRGQLKALVQEDPRRVLLYPEPGISGHFQIGADSIRRLLSCTHPSPAMLDALRDFRAEFRGQTP